MTALRRLGFALLCAMIGGLGPAVADDSSDISKTASPAGSSTATDSAAPAPAAPDAPKLYQVRAASAHRGAWDALVATFGIEQGCSRPRASPSRSPGCVTTTRRCRRR